MIRSKISVHFEDRVRSGFKEGRYALERRIGLLNNV